MNSAFIPWERTDGKMEGTIMDTAREAGADKESETDL